MTSRDNHEWVKAAVSLKQTKALSKVLFEAKVDANLNYF
jgi:hypothetical protein